MKGTYIIYFECKEKDPGKTKYKEQPIWEDIVRSIFSPYISKMSSELEKKIGRDFAVRSYIGAIPWSKK